MRRLLIVYLVFYCAVIAGAVVTVSAFRTDYAFRPQVDIPDYRIRAGTWWCVGNAVAEVNCARKSERFCRVLVS